MRRAFIAAVVAGVVIGGLTGCDDPSARTERQYNKCVESGGSWIDGAWGTSCVMPDYKEAS